MRTISLLILLAAGSTAQTPGLAFASLQHLSANWQATAGAKSTLIRLNLRSISNDSAIVETFSTPSGRETLTIYHADGSRLLATHYCAQGNQPRLVLDAAGSATELTFRFLDATNLKSADSSQLVRIVFRLQDDDHFEKAEVYRSKGVEESTAYRFTRVH